MDVSHTICLCRSVTTVLTIFPDERWELEQGKLYDVTHLPCRAARYIPVTPAGTPANANLKDFPVRVVVFM